MTEKQKTFLAHLAEARGIVQIACLKSEITREQFNDWHGNPEFRAKCYIIQEETNDWVEAQLLRLIRDGIPSAIMFYCKTKLKNRGYSDEIDFEEKTSDKDIQVIINEEILRVPDLP